MRIELRDGQWAELRERITHGEDKALKLVVRAARRDPDQAFDFDTAVVRTFVVAWEVRDLKGEPIRLDAPDAIERAPSDVIDLLVEQATKLWTGATSTVPTPAPSGA